MKALIKEDGITFQNIFESYLNKLNIEVVFLKNASQIPELLSENTFDFYILSSTTDEETEVLISYLQKYEKGKKSPIIFCGTDLNSERKLDYIQKGIYSFLKKPFSLENLKNTLELVFPKTKRYDDLEILIAEDSEPTQKVLKIYLSKHGLKVHFACDGKEALELLLEDPNQFSLIITDLHMPNIDGITLAKTIRYTLGISEIPILFLSAEEELQSSNEFSSLANGWIQKPFSSDIYQNLLPYLEKAEIYKKIKELKKENQNKSKFIQSLYSKFEKNCFINIQLLLDFLLKSHFPNTNLEEKDLTHLIAQQLEKDSRLLREFFLEHANSFALSNTINIKQLGDEALKSLAKLIEYKKLEIDFRIATEFVILKYDSFLLQLTFYEFLSYLIFTLENHEKLTINSYIQEEFLYLEFQIQNTNLKNFPLWIFEKTNIQFGIQETNKVKTYSLQIELIQK